MFPAASAMSVCCCHDVPALYEHAVPCQPCVHHAYSLHGRKKKPVRLPAGSQILVGPRAMCLPTYILALCLPAAGCRLRWQPRPCSGHVPPPSLAWCVVLLAYGSGLHLTCSLARSGTALVLRASDQDARLAASTSEGPWPQCNLVTVSRRLEEHASVVGWSLLT